MSSADDRLQVGQQLWRQERYGTGHYVIVTKVGTKWAYLDEGPRVDRRTLAPDGTLWNASIWRSEEAYKEAAAIRMAWDDFRRKVSNTYRAPDGVRISQIENATRALFKDAT